MEEDRKTENREWLTECGLSDAILDKAAALPFWELVRQFSSQRKNLIEWLPVEEGEKVLECRAGAGPLSTCLEKMGAQLVCQEKDDFLREILEKRLEGRSAKIVKDAAEAGDLFHWIVCADEAWFWEGGSLSFIKEHLLPGGKAVIAVDNPYGLQHFAGMPDMYSASAFGGIEGRSGRGGEKSRTYEYWLSAIEEAGLHLTEEYYPYPDVFFPEAIFSPEHLPSAEELMNEGIYWKGERLTSFKEQAAWPGILEAGYFNRFSHSYLFIAEA